MLTDFHLDQEVLDQLEMSLEEAREVCTPIAIGPTWQRCDDGSWKLPELTLGWEIAEWCAKYLQNDEGEPWRFTLEQLRFILWWYAIDERGRFIYRNGVLQRMKGWGKDPLLAVLAVVELLGPAHFDYFDEAGKPVGMRHPRAYVQVTAVNQAQTGNTMDLIPALLTDQLKAAHGLKASDIGLEIIRAYQGRVKLVAVTSSYRALEGKRPTFTILNETHHWVAGNSGHQMYDTISDNATKIAGGMGRYLAITNAYAPDEDSVAQKMRESYEDVVEGRAPDVGMLYDSLEAHPRAPLSGPLVPHVLKGVRGDAYWLDIESILSSIGNSRRKRARSRRMWYNQVVAGEDFIHGPETMKAMEDPSIVLAPGDEIVLGFDGGKSDDATALVAIRIRDGAMFLLCLEEEPPDWASRFVRDDKGKVPTWEVNRIKVDSAVHEAFRTYTVRAFYADVALWESYITDWAEAYGEQLSVKAHQNNAIAWDMRGSRERSVRAHERFLDATLDEPRLKYDGDLSLRRHFLNVQRRDTQWGVSFGKDMQDSTKKVDAYAAAMLAHEALTDLRTKRHQKTKRPKTGNAWFM